MTPVIVPRRDRRHTEGVGETLEDLFLRPADALRRSPEPARRGGSSIRPRHGPARVKRSPTHAMPKIDCGDDYFFFRRLVAFFFVFAAFFLRFAIAALLV